MRHIFSSLFLCIFLTGCASTGSLLDASDQVSQITLTGSVSFIQSTAQNIQDAYTITVNTLHAVKVGIERRVDSVQQGVEKIQEGKELIQEGVM